MFNFIKNFIFNSPKTKYKYGETVYACVRDLHSGKVFPMHWKITTINTDGVNTTYGQFAGKDVKESDCFGLLSEAQYHSDLMNGYITEDEPEYLVY